MVSITIRNLDDDVKRRLRLRAAEHHRSIEEEVRIILCNAVKREKDPRNLEALFAPASSLSAAWTWSCRRASTGASRPPSTERGALALLVDTNVVSGLVRRSPDLKVIDPWKAG